MEDESDKMLQYDNGIDLTSKLNTTNATYTVPSNGYVYIRGCKSTSTNGVCEILVLKNETEVDRFIFQERTANGCNFTGHLVVNKDVQLKVSTLNSLTQYSIIFYPFK